jgi:two-component system OmpR family response regulator
MKTLERVIYVDDEDDIREVALIALEDVGGLSVEAFSSGAALLAAGPVPPDLILLDVMMPAMDGPAVLRALRQLPGFATVPAIFMTAKVHPLEINALLAEGAIGVVSKPFDPMQLADEIRRLHDKA